MHQQAQLRLMKDEVEKLGAEVYVVLAMDLHRTQVFKEENLLLSKGKGPFSREKSLVYATALSDPAGYASALYGVARKCLRWGAWVENQPHWFVIDRTGTVVYQDVTPPVDMSERGAAARERMHQRGEQLMIIEADQCPRLVYSSITGAASVEEIVAGMRPYIGV